MYQKVSFFLFLNTLFLIKDQWIEIKVEFKMPVLNAPFIYANKVNLD
jgi:hypothetical protein